MVLSCISKWEIWGLVGSVGSRGEEGPFEVGMDVSFPAGASLELWLLQGLTDAQDSSLRL